MEVSKKSCYLAGNGYEGLSSKFSSPLIRNDLKGRCASSHVFTVTKRTRGRLLYKEKRFCRHNTNGPNLGLDSLKLS